MRLSKRGEYGLRAMIRLADLYDPQEPTRPFQIKELAEVENIPVKYLEQILLALKNAGLLNSRRGLQGGYYLAKKPSEINMGQIIRTLDGPLAPIRCVSSMAYEPCDCPDERTCGLRLIMLEVRNKLSDILDNTTLDDIGDMVDKVL
jgi:Rrf2 family protein